MQCTALAIVTSAKDRYKVSRKVAPTVAAQRTDWIEQVKVFRNAALDAVEKVLSCRSFEASNSSDRKLCKLH